MNYGSSQSLRPDVQPGSARGVKRQDAGERRTKLKDGPKVRRRERAHDDGAAHGRTHVMRLGRA
jgi:hypothetical protein